MEQSEYKLQLCVVDHLYKTFPEVGFFHVPNRPGDATDAYFKKMMGAKPGVSDLILGWRPGKVGVIELKAEGKKISTPQNKFLSWADWVGWETAVCHTVRGVHMTLCRWGLKPKHGYSIIEPDYRTKEEKLQQQFDMYKPR